MTNPAQRRDFLIPLKLVVQYIHARRKEKLPEADSNLEIQAYFQ